MLRIINESSNPPPKYAHDDDAGLDLMSNEEVIIPPYSIYAVGTGLKMAIEKGNYGAVCSRSGLALRGIVVNNAPGIIDSNYRGEVKVILYNQTNNAFRVRVGDRVAQLIICSYLAPEIRCVSVLDDTERGIHGFGSTGT